MSGFPYSPPTQNAITYNNLFWSSASDFLRLSGSVVTGPTAFLGVLSINGDLKVNGSDVDLSYISGITPGQAQANKALVVNGSRILGNIHDINSTGRFAMSNTQFGLIHRYTTGGSCELITYNSGQTASVGTYTNSNFGIMTNNNTRINVGNSTSKYSVAINDTPSVDTGQLHINGNSGPDFNGSTSFYNLLSMETGGNVKLNAMINKSDSVAYFGTTTAHTFNIMTNNVNRITIPSSGNVGINNTTPACSLDVAIGTSISIPSSYGQYSSSGYGSGMGPTSFSFVARFNGNTLTTGNAYITSDRRKKKDLEIIDSTYYSKLYELDVYKYHLTFQEDTEAKSYGLIAQDVAKAGYFNFLNLTPCDDLKVEDASDIENLYMSLNYQNITMANFSVIKKLMQQVDELTKKIEQLTDVIA